MANKITYADKVAINPAGTAINQVQDVDLNEIKAKHNLNDDRITQNENKSSRIEDITLKVGSSYVSTNLIGESFELGSLSGADGSEVTSTVRIRSAEFTEIADINDNLYLKFLSNNFNIFIYWYDENYDFISTESGGYRSVNAVIDTIPDDCKYARCIFQWRDNTSLVFDDSYLNDLGISLLSEKLYNENIKTYIESRERNIETNIVLDIDSDAINIGKTYTRNSSLAGAITRSKIRLLSELMPIDNHSKYIINYKSNDYTALIVSYDINEGYVTQGAYGVTSFISDGIHNIRLLIKRNDDAELVPLDAVYSGIEVTKDASYNYTGNYFPSDENYWEQGSLSGADGSEVATTSRLRTGKIPIVGGNYFAIKFTSSVFTVVINAYDKDDVWLGIITSYPTVDNYYFVDDIAYIRLVSKYQDGTTPMLPSAMNNLGITFSRDNTYFSGIAATKTELAKINVMTNNVGLFNSGVTIGIPAAELDQGIIDWKALITENQQDIIFLQELPTEVDESKTIDTYETLYKDIYPYFTKQYNSQGWLGIASKYPFVATEDQFASARQWLYGTINIGGVEIAIANVHLTPGETNGAIRATEIAEIIAQMSGKDNVIIGGDFNTWLSTELDDFVTDGYKLANWGYFGTINTVPSPLEAFDNIIVKGGQINTSNVSSLIATSDHHPLYSSISF